MTRTHRAPRHAVLLVAALVSALALVLGVGGSQAADARLDLADDALVNAADLLAASTTGGEVSAKQQRAFDRAIARAIDHIDEARAEIVKAQNAVDNP